MSTERTAAKGPVLIDLEQAPAVNPAQAPMVPEAPERPRQGGAHRAEPQAGRMAQLLRLTRRKPARLFGWGAALLLGLALAALSVAAYDFAAGLITRLPVLGYAVALALAGLLALSGVMALRELLAYGRLRRLERIRARCAQMRAGTDLAAARRALAQLPALYAGRAELSWACARYESHAAEAVDVAALYGVAERELLQPLDKLALAEVDAAARQVALVSALVPLALADVAVALVANLRMIRRIAEIYGGRAGVLGNWRLLRAVLGHVLATGAVALGDDLIGSLAGGGVLSKVSRRFGEGVINGALSARVGLAAMELCRPLAFEALARPSASATVARALKGLFGSAKAAD